jgi:AcrR family transcriptional regulator
MARARSSPPLSRDRVFAAAAAEFAARGYAGANMDRIARAARLNKAMIYYHFKSKAALYREILRDMFGAVGKRVGDVAARDASPEDKIRAYIEATLRRSGSAAALPPIWLREFAEGGEHVDAATLSYVRDVLGAERHHREGPAGRFQPRTRMLVQAGIIAPLMFFSPRARAPEGRTHRRAGVTAISRDMVVAHIQRSRSRSSKGKSHE